MSTRGREDRASIVRQRLRDSDHDRYLATLFAPKEARDHLFALYATNAELARIGPAVSEPLLGEIRLQWWRDALAPDAASTGDPVADAFARTIRECALDRSRISELIDARSFDVSGAAMPDMRALRTYLGKTEGALFALAAQIVCGDDTGAAIARAAQSGGIAMGIVNILRRLPHDLVRGANFLPQDELVDAAAASPRHEDASPDVAPLLSGLRTEARQSLETAHSELQQCSKKARLAFLPLALTEPYLEILERPGFDATTQIAELPPLRKLWRLWRAA